MSTTASSGTRRAFRTATSTPRKHPTRGAKHRKAHGAVIDYIMARTMIMLNDAYQNELAKKCRVPAAEAYQHWCEMNSLMQQSTTLRDSAIAALRAMWGLGIPPHNVERADDFIRERGFLDHFQGVFGITYKQFKIARVNLDRFRESLQPERFQIDYDDTQRGQGKDGNQSRGMSLSRDVPMASHG